MLSPEVFGVVADAACEARTSTANLPLRGVGPMAPQLRKDFTLVQGKMFTPGTNEIIVGDGAVKQFEGLDVGNKVRWLKTDWQVVGRFTDDGGLAESEVWGDAATLQQAWQRGPTLPDRSRAKLAEGASLKTLKDALTKNPQLTVDVLSEKAVLRRSAEGHVERSSTASACGSPSSWASPRCSRR